MSERLDAIRRWLARDRTERFEVSLDDVTAQRLRNLAAGRSEPEVLSFLASHILEDVLEAEDLESRVNEHREQPGVGDPAPDAEVLTPEGKPVTLSSRWADGPAALVFLRHYG